MKSQFSAGKLFAATAFSMLSVLVPVHSVFADELTNTTQPPRGSVEISPICSNASGATTYWQVNNKNSFDATVDWTAIDNGNVGSYTAAPGITEMGTYYDGSDHNNTTNFKVATDDFTRNATETACEPVTDPEPVACVDGNIQQNLTYVFTAPNVVELHTLDDAPLCNDVNLYLSSYIMPSTYNGQGFEGNPTAYPQTVFDSTPATLAAGTNGATELSVDMPDSCNPIQVDLYYAPEITTVGNAGHGTQNIYGTIYPSTGSCEIVTAPTEPTGPTVPSVPTTPANGSGGVVESASTMAPVSTGKVLSDTGTSPVVPAVIASLLLLATILVARKQTNRSI